MKKLFNCAVLWLAFASMALAKSPKNIIIMIGDGMGINQIQAAYTQNGGHLNMTDRCPFVGCVERTPPIVTQPIRLPVERLLPQARKRTTEWSV